ncbi:MAG: chitobiase/beta-hexosaminidase C-terminal domain-containing protein, partial [Prevotella sp.]|nr:chitobiase/beta-hexosaminidase C-terminal domain-containing protein [Prevotella sp.]
SSIQLRSNKSTDGIVSTTSGGKIKSVKITFNSNTSNDRTVEIYGSNTAYESAADLYDASKQGTSLGTAAKAANALEHTITVTGDYEYIGIRSKKDAMYISSISIVWETKAASTVAKPTFSVGGETVTGSTEVEYGAEVTLTQADAAFIVYTTDGETPSYADEVGDTYEAPIKITKDVTIKAIAVSDDEEESDVATAAFTVKRADAPTLSETTKTFSEAFTVTITANDANATGILYTLDGTDPTENDDAELVAGKTATVDIPAEGTTTLRAVSVNDDFFASKEAKAVYTYRDPSAIEKGDIDNPYTVAEVIAKNPTNNTAAAEDKDKWVKGYIVGAFVSNEFKTTGITADTNIALADNANETNVANVIPIALPSGTIRTNLKAKSDSDNEHMLGNQVLIRADIARYFSVPGMRDADDAYIITNVTGAGYATFSSSATVDLSSVEGLEAYAVKEFTAEKATLEKITTAVPAHTGVVLKGAAGEYRLHVVASGTAPATNLLQPTSKKGSVNAAGTQYGLGQNNGKVGFMQVTSGTTIAANKAYLVGDFGAKSFVPFDETTDGITTVEAQQLNPQAPMYNLAGQRVSATYKGVVIQNGRKFVNK